MRLLGGSVWMTYCVDLFLNTKLLTLRLFNSPGAKARRGKKKIKFYLGGNLRSTKKKNLKATWSAKQLSA